VPPTTRKTSPATPPAAPAGVLERGLVILECFDELHLRLRLRELAERTGLDKATLLRLLGTFARYGYVQRLDDGRYSPGPAPLRLGMLYRATFDLGARLQSVLQRVVEDTGETVAFYIRNGDERTCLYRENTPREVRHHVEVGTRLPLAAGGSSAHILQVFTGGSSPHEADIKSKGYVATRAERIPDMASIAVPVFEGDGTFLGSLVVIGPASRLTKANQLAAMRSAERELKARGFSMQPPPGYWFPAPDREP
jgi:DNA-binding IclR family transcriptional regulator